MWRYTFLKKYGLMYMTGLRIISLHIREENSDKRYGRRDDNATNDERGWDIVNDVKRRARERFVMSEREKAAEAQRRQIGSYSGDRVKKIAAKTQEGDGHDGRLRVAAYCRVSTDDIDQVISIELQKDEYQKKIKENPAWEYMGTYVDDGFSGTNTEHRPGFRLMMQAAMSGQLDVIITKSVSRFARNLLDCIGWVTRLQDANPPVKVIFEMEGIDTLATTTNLILTILAVVAEEESHMKSEAILLSLEWRFSRGRFLTPRLFGYDLVKVEDGFGGYRKILKPVEAEARVVRWIYERIVSGASLEDIAARLTELEIPTGGRKKDKTVNTVWTGNRVAALVRNERYCGDVLGRKTYTPNYKTHKSKKNNGKKNKYFQSGHHEAIVSRTLWNSAQRILNSRKFGHDGTYLPMRIVKEGPLTGYISMNPRWAGYTTDDYFRMCNIAMGLAEGEAVEDLENEYLPEGGYRMDGLMDDQGIQRIARELTREEQAMKEKLEGKGESAEEDAAATRPGRVFQIVRGDMFSRITDPVMRVTPSTITCNRQCTGKLPESSYVEILMNPVERAIVVRPCAEDDPNAVMWRKDTGATYLCGILYDIMGWDETYSYKLPATVKTNGDETVLYFDMDNYIGRAIGRKTDEAIIPEKRDRPQESEETKGFFYGPDDSEPQSVEEIRAIEERLREARKAERRTFGEPAFQFFSGDAAVLEGEGSLMTEAVPVSAAPEIGEEETEYLLLEIMDDPPAFPYGKVIYSTDDIVAKGDKTGGEGK